MRTEKNRSEGNTDRRTFFDRNVAFLAMDRKGNQVYCLPNDYINRDYLTDIPKKEYHDPIVLRDLKTDEPVSIHADDISLYSVPDAQLGHLLRLFGIRGDRVPYKMRPVSSNPSEIPFEGNVMGPIWASICLGGTCNNKCIFCFTKWIKDVPDIETTQVMKVIDRLADIDSIKTLLFTGGEPTIRSDLISLFSYANQVGFQDIELQTNGREFKNINLVKKLVKYGLRRVLLSLHGPNERVHDSISSMPGSFKESIRGLQNLIQYSVEPVINTVVCRANYDTLVDIVQSVDSLMDCHRKIRFSYPIIEGAAFDHVDDVIIPFSEVLPNLSEAIKLANKLGIEIEYANMPLCICNPSLTTYDRIKLSEFVVASPFYKYNIPRGEKSVKLNICSQCSKNWLCPGIQVEYLRSFPENIYEFRPIE